MLVVSDATPLNVLIRLGVVDILHALYGRVVIPPAVHRELSHVNTPVDVSRWIAAPPHWLEVVPPSNVESARGPNSGEREAIALAIELKADFLLADDKSARSHARQLRVPVTGTIGVLRLAASRDLVELGPTLARLAEAGFFIDPAVVRAAIEADDRRREAGGPR